MKRLYTSLLFTLFSVCVFCQNAYYDALRLRNYTITNANGTIFNRINEVSIDSVLSKYAFGAFPNEKIKAYYKDRPIPNPFLKDLIPSDWPSNDNNKIKTNLVGASSLSSFGSLNVTNIADGIAQFLIKRGKEELNVAFFNRLKKFLDSTEECKVLFPQTIEVFKNVAPYQYAEFIQSLREAFKKDLGNLIIGLNELIELPKYEELLKNLPEIRVALRSAKIVQELSQSDGGILPDSIITELAALEEWGEIDVNLGSSWKLLNLISQSVRDSASINNAPTDTVLKRWVTLSDMNKLIKDSVTLKIFLGLVYQKAEGIYFKTAKKDSISVQQFMSSNVNNILSIVALVENFITLANDVDRTIKDFKDKQKNNLLTNDDYYTYISKAVNITEYGFKAANTIYRFKHTNKEDLLDNRYIIIAKNGNELYKNIYTKNYNNAVMNAYIIIDQLFNNKDSLVQEKVLSKNLDESATATLTRSVASIKVPGSKTIDAILKYGNFMASVVKAESGEEVESALEAVALPAGSYSIKQKSAFNFSVNGYIGYAWDFNGGLYAHGIYAPVGFSVNTGSNKKHGVTFSAFLSLIDVGSVATYRLQDDSTKTLKQDIRLESIFAPSAQILIEPIHGFPLAIGGGWRRTPKLFYSGDTSFDIIPSKNVFNVSVLIDIPIFTIVNKSFIKK